VLFPLKGGNEDGKNAEELLMTMIGHNNPCWCGRWAILGSLGLAMSLVSPQGAEAAPPPAGLAVLCAVGQANDGSIKGRLVWGGEKVPPVVELVAKGQAQKDPNVCATNQAIVSHDLEIDPKTKGVAYGFAFLYRPKAGNPGLVQALISKTPKVEMDQKNCDFLPHSVAIHQDQTLVMKSSDPVGHNVRLTGFSNPGMNQIVAPNGHLDVKLVAERFPLKVECNIHPWMHGNVMVFDHPFFAVTGRDGAFELRGVPPGDYTLVVWQEKVGYVTPGLGRGMPVTVTAGQVADAGEIKIDPVKVKAN
jgi:hypothetical protein